MKLVIDANIAFSLLKKDSFTRRLVQTYSLEMYSHKFILDELKEHCQELCELLNLSAEKFERLMEILSRLVNLDVKVSPQQLNWAGRLISDQDDKQYLALAIKLNCPIWSEDPHFKEQTKVPVFTTLELSKFLE